MPIRHKKVATLPDRPGVEINKGEWNDDHTNPDIADVDGLVAALAAKYDASNPASYITSAALTGYLLSSTAASTYATLSGVASDIAGREPTITAGTTAQYWRGDKSWQTLDKAAVGLGNVDNTTDANKPVSTAQAAANAAVQAFAIQRANHTGSQAISTVTGLQTALDAKAPLASPAFTGTVTGITATMVGLGNVNNTSDAAKPVSTAQAAADTAVQAFAIQRANHTGSQLASTISDFAATVRSTVLTGVSVATSQVIAATDTVLQAFGYLQAQITALTSTVAGKANITGQAFTGSITATNLSNTNTGDQFLFGTIAVAGQSNVVADSTNDTLTLVAGTNVTITTNATTDTITINATGGGGGGTWGSITGTLSTQTDLQAALDAKQATLISGTNIKTVNGENLLGSGDIVISGGGGGLTQAQVLARGLGA